MGISLDEIAMKISEEEDNLIAKAFTMQIATLLRQNGIIPIMERTEETHKIEHVKSNYIFSKKFGFSFNELNCEEHDRIVYNKVIDDFVEKVRLHYLGVHPDELYEKYYPREICITIGELAERLKEEHK